MVRDFLIDGELRHHTSKTYEVFASHSGEVIATVPDGSEEDVNMAVAAAKRAYEGGWGTMDSEARTTLLLRWADAVKALGPEIASLEGLETGRPTKGGNMDFFAEYIRYFAGWVNKLYGDVLQTGNEYINYVISEPLGVVTVMPAWNTVASGAIQKAAPALAAGNAVVIRAPDEAPLSTLLLAKTVIEAGFPPGVVNIICGSTPMISSALVDHPDIALVSFTGSVATGKRISEAASRRLARTVMELGGKSPYVIFADADVERAVTTGIDCSFSFQGQSCSAPSRWLVERSILDQVLELVKKRVSLYKPALPDDPCDSPRIGPLFNKKQYETVVHYVEIGKRDGALVAGGKRITGKPFDGGYYYEPTVFLFEEMDSAVVKEEIFGPVVSIIAFDSIEDAIEKANVGPFGLAAGVWSNDIGKLMRCARSIKAGTVWENSYFMYTIHSPWGGFKESGFGREFGKYALEPYQDYKSVWLNR